MEMLIMTFSEHEQEFSQKEIQILSRIKLEQENENIIEKIIELTLLPDISKYI